MPWELGYFDGRGGRVGITPLVKQNDNEFKNQEYLGLYPFVDITEDSGSLWINGEGSAFASLSPWVKKLEEIRQH